MLFKLLVTTSPSALTEKPVIVTVPIVKSPVPSIEVAPEIEPLTSNVPPTTVLPVAEATVNLSVLTLKSASKLAAWSTFKLPFTVVAYPAALRSTAPPPTLVFAVVVVNTLASTLAIFACDCWISADSDTKPPIIKSAALTVKSPVSDASLVVWPILNLSSDIS